MQASHRFGFPAARPFTSPDTLSPSIPYFRDEIVTFSLFNSDVTGNEESDAMT